MCDICRDVGWVLDYAGGGRLVPIGIELLPCPVPDCRHSGKRISSLSVPVDPGFIAVTHPNRRGIVMGLTAATPSGEPDLLAIAFAPDHEQVP